MMKSIHHMHSNGIFHRDIKPENVLVLGNTLKVCDFGSSRTTTAHGPLTEYISTRWYRSPECLLTKGSYSASMDIWSAACVLYELYCNIPLFPGKSEPDQIDLIYNLLGIPPAHVIAMFKKNPSRVKVL